MPKRSADYMKSRREQILDAACECALTQGWSRTTIDDVASGAGLSKGAVYVHFANKRELLAGLIRRNMEEIEAYVDFTTLEDLRKVLLDSVDLLAGPRGRVAATGNLEVQLEAVRDPELQEVLRAGTARLVEVVSLMIHRMRPDLDEPGIVTAALGLIYLLEGMRSFRALSDAVSEAQMRAVLERQLETLRA